MFEGALCVWLYFWMKFKDIFTILKDPLLFYFH